MAKPTTRAEFKAHVLRKLGDGAIRVNVTDDQVDDRVDEALDKYYQFHSDGSAQVFLAHTVDANTISNKYITVDASILGVTEVFDGGIMAGTSNDLLNNTLFQIYMSDIQNLDMSGVISNYVVMRLNLQTVRDFLIGKQQIRFNQHMNRIYLDTAREKLVTGRMILFRAYQKVDPETYPDVWGDHWLQRYTTALVRLQWGDQLSKYSGVQVTGGVSFNGPQIVERAQREIELLEQELKDTYFVPAEFFIT